MAIREFRLPDPGEGLVEADIVTWRVAVGDQVKINDIVVEVETSKSLVELPSPYAGTVTELLVAEGETVDVGAPIIAIDDGVAAEPRRDDGAADELLPLRPRRRGRHGSEAPEDGRRRPADGWRCWSATGPRRPRRSGGRARPTAADPEREQAHAMMAGTFATDAPVSRRADEREPLLADAAAVDRQPAAGARSGRARAGAQRWRRAGQAAGSQAGQGSRGRPGHDHRQRTGWSDHPRRRDSARGGGAEGAGARDLTARAKLRLVGASRSDRPRRSRTSDPDQGRAQGDGAGHGAVGLHRAARQRVADLRRDRHHGTGRPADARAASSPRSRSRRC